MTSTLAAPYRFRTPWCPVEFPLTAAFFASIHAPTTEYEQTPLWIQRYTKATLTLDVGRRLVQSITLLTRLQHPHILALYGVYEDATHIHVVMEPPLETLAGAAAITEATMIAILPPLLDVLEYLDGRKIYHKNVCAHTIVRVADGTWKLAGFRDALDTHLYAHDTIAGFRDPLNVPPELLTDATVEPAAMMVFSLGVMLYDVLVPNKAAAAYGELTRAACNFIGCCTKTNPVDRWSVRDLRRHPWIHATEVVYERMLSAAFPELVERFTRASMELPGAPVPVLPPTAPARLKKKRWYRFWSKS